ncbi:preprotein translocase subunit YajC [bacterium]|nr:preprotein translocase subunit YajC [bacterium]
MLSIWPQAMILAATTAPTAGQGTAQGDQGKVMLFAFALIAVVFWLLILRPQKKEQVKREQMMDSLGKGDKVMTNGGMLGTIESVDKAKGTVMITVAPKVSIEFNRAAVANIVQKKGKPAGEKAEAEEKKSEK